MDLHALRADEFAYLPQKLSPLELRFEHSFAFKALLMCWRYVEFVTMTWVKSIWDFVFFPTSEFAFKLTRLMHLIIVSRAD